MNDDFIILNAIRQTTPLKREMIKLLLDLPNNERELERQAKAEENRQKRTVFTLLQGAKGK